MASTTTTPTDIASPAVPPASSASSSDAKNDSKAAATGVSSDTKDGAPAGVFTDIPIPTVHEELAAAGDALLSQVQSLFAADWYIRASRLYHRIDAAITSSLLSVTPPCASSTREVLVALQKRMRNDDWRYIRNIESELQKVLDNTSSLTGWEEAGDKSGIKTYYRAVPGTSTHTFYTIGNVDAPLEHILPLMYEIDLMTTWLPALSATRRLATLANSRFRMIAQLHVPLMFPLSSREVLLYGYGDVQSNGSVAIFFRSTNGTDSFTAAPDVPTSATSSTSSTSSSSGYAMRLPAEPSGFVRAALHFGGFIITPIKPNVCEVKTVFNLDPALAVVPYWLLNFVSQKFCYVLLSYLRSTAQKLATDRDSEFAKRIIANRGDVYGEIRRRIALFHPATSGVTSSVAPSAASSSSSGAVGR